MSEFGFTIEEKGVLFDIHESKPWRIPDEFRKETVPFVRNERILPFLPESASLGYDETRTYWIPERGEWVAFNFCSFQEKSYGPNEEDIEGPYVLPSLDPPTAEEAEKARSEGTLVGRRLVIYEEEGGKLKAEYAAQMDKDTAYWVEMVRFDDVRMLEEYAGYLKKDPESKRTKWLYEQILSRMSGPDQATGDPYDFRTPRERGDTTEEVGS